MASQLSCENSYLYPPVNFTERASLSYALFGRGIQPFNSSYVVARGDYSAIFYVSGTKISSAEAFPFEHITLNPSGVVAITSTSVTRDLFGFVNFTATAENVGSQPLERVFLGFAVPGNWLYNQTYDGITWSQDNRAQCADTLLPHSTCSASFRALNESIAPGGPFNYRIQVLGADGNTTIVYQEHFQGTWPTKGVSSYWVSSFIQQVNSNRTGPKLVEDQMLDAFAAARFQTQVANYNVSNYGFQGDYSTSFPGSTRQIGEVTLWPGADSPSGYVSVLQQSAPGHWSVLTNPSYTHFGYYIGYGPTIIVSQPCQVTEFPGGQNIPALLASHGCQFHIEQTVWLVIEVGS